MSVIEAKALSDSKTHELLPPFSGPDRDCVLAELARLLASHHFKGSRRCSDFLDHVVRKTLKGDSGSLKERILGVELFNRKTNYDTNSDPIVRATAGEVRKRIAQHYQESESSFLRIVLPVGIYIPRFSADEDASQNAGADVSVTPLPLPAPLPAFSPTRENVIEPVLSSQRTKSPMRIGVYAFLTVVFLASLILFGKREMIAPRPAQSPQVYSALRTFWQPFVSSQADTVAVFSEVKHHTGPNSLGSTKLPSAIKFGNMASPGFSGVGEVMGMHALDGAIYSLHGNLRAKRSRFFTFDDAQNENVIFLGSPLTNPALALIQNTRDFTFQIVSTPSGDPALAIVNNQPMPGEPKEFLATPDTIPIKNDYAIIALYRGLRPRTSVLVLAGITTFGTQAAAEFVSREDSLKSLMSKVRVSRNGEIEPFEAVISVRIDDEVPGEEQIVAVHQTGQ